MFRNGDIIMVTDVKEHIFEIQGEVIGHNHITDEVAYKIIANGYRGIAVHATKAKNCTLIKRDGMETYINDSDQEMTYIMRKDFFKHLAETLTIAGIGMIVVLTIVAIIFTIFPI